MEYTIQHGRPAEKRSPVEEACYDALDALGIDYDRIDHETAATMEDLAPAREALGCHIYKNLFLTNRQQTAFFLLLMPGDKPFKTKYLSGQAGTSRLSFASAEQLQEYLGVAPGSASVLALINDPENRVKLLIDRDAAGTEYFGCHPCRNTTSLKIRTQDILDVFLPSVGHEPLFVELPWQPE